VIILAIDPGTAIIGYALVNHTKGLAPKILSYGTIQTPKNIPPSDRLKVIYDDIQVLLATSKPDVVAMESLFFFRNVNTAMPVAEARGVMLLACAQNNMPATSYTPMQVKMAVTGHGKADKKAVQEAVKDLFGLAKIPKPDDAADALAIAWTHLAHLEGGYS
jgi:crossover junction endodeoxyribonuclease RuvC